LQAYAGSNAELPAWVNDHLQSCHHCAEEWSAYQALFQALSVKEPLSLSPDLEARILAEFSVAQPVPRQRAGWWLVGALCFLLAVGVPLAFLLGYDLLQFSLPASLLSLVFILLTTALEIKACLGTQNRRIRQLNRYLLQQKGTVTV